MTNLAQAPEVRKISPELETRDFAGTVEIRAMEDGKKKLAGYAMKFDQKYNVSFFTEQIARTALDKADMTDVRALLNHDPNYVLGRTSADTLRLSVDETGLRYEIDLPDTQAARDLAVSVERGDITQSSWGFTLGMDANSSGDVWTRENGKDHRTITGVKKVYDVSPVTFPANPDTSVAKRSLEQYKKRDGGEAMPSPEEIKAGIIEGCTEVIDELNSAVACCTSFNESAQNYTTIDPDNADLYAAAADLSMTAAEASKAAISALTEIIAAANGQRSDNGIINQRRLQAKALMARFPNK